MIRTRLRFATLIALILFAGTVVLAGQHEEPREGGLTGTGIVGIVTELGSIRVNDQRIVFEKDMPLSSPLGQFSAENLRPGHSVAAMVVRSGTDWLARELVQTYPVIGPIQSQTSTELTVMGTKVDVSKLAFLQQMQVGDWIAVSGLWRGDEVLASMVEQVAPQEYAQLFGSYVEPAENDVLRIGGSIIDSIILEHARPGDVIRVFGIPTQNGLQAREVDLGLFKHPVGIILVQGFVVPTGPGGHYSVPGSGIRVFVPEMPTAMENEAVKFCGFSENPDAGTDPRWAEETFELLNCNAVLE